MEATWLTEIQSFSQSWQLILPFPFINFNNSQTTITFTKGRDVNIVRLLSFQLRICMLKTPPPMQPYGLHGETISQFHPKATVYKVYASSTWLKTISSDDPTISFVSVNLLCQQNQHYCWKWHFHRIGGPYTNVAGQLIFPGENRHNLKFLKVLLDALQPKLQNKTNLDFYVSVFEYPHSAQLHNHKQISALFMNNTKSYADKNSRLSLRCF